ncbi:amidohydrolase family protein [Roseomonas sp. CECT 9278]|uniref:amidohydrolase family protein n=1 Tax=Roseomonas sp. CECT 9278 TaxID=2845823 RepID=UPI001E312836|nr:amidohydrolase family protein [Roseomonas sp. CECT 9278]CAH0257829.1 N-isopropylammelide isopropyl amidohydrolase [Roseomonas sp. CECT 9278]
MTDLLLRNVRPMGGPASDVLVRGGRIAAPGADATGAAVEDGQGLLLLPGFVEGHTHLDKTVFHERDWLVNEVGPRIVDKIDTEREWRARTGHDAGAASLAMARAFLAAGTTRIRSHVDVDTSGGTRHVERVLATREAMRGVQEIQVVAFPQSGILGRQGTESLLDAAMAMGADIVGGLDPCAIERDPVRHLNIVFGLAEKHRKPVDIHLHEQGSMGAFSLELILERTRALSMQGQVVVSHAFCLGDVTERDRDALLAQMADLGVAIATTAPASRPVPLVAACRAAGVTIFGGNDGIRDTWTPYGSPDMLERAMLVGLRNNFRRDDEIALAFDCVSTAGAKGCGFEDYGLHPGARADLVLVDARALAEAVVVRPPRRLVVAGGRIVGREGVLLA